MVKRKKETEEITTTDEPVAIETATCQDKLRTSLEEVKTYDGVVGYILRNTTSASVDLKDPAKIVDYATLSSTAFEATEELSEIFEIGNLKDIIVNGKNLKMLSLIVDENKISVFMENNADTEKVMRKIQMT
jgi:predicted regulator of Ras-like GTPase activity (Roadblock/LC7/MglB family)